MAKVERTRQSSLSFIGIEDGIFISEANGFSGAIKMRPADFVVNEIDPSGARVEVSSFVAPRFPSTSPHSTLTSTTTTAEGAEAVSCTRSNSKQEASAGQGSPAKDQANQDCETANNRKTDAMDGLKAEAEVYGPSEQLRLLVGSEGLARLVAINSAAKDCATTGSVNTIPQELKDFDASTAASNPDLNRVNGSGVPNSETEASQVKNKVDRKTLVAGAGLEPGCVRIPAGHLADKAERAKVHRAVQETFPFVKTTTERGPGDAVTVVCAGSEPHPTLRKLLSASDLEALQRLVNCGPNATAATHGIGEGMALVCDPDREHRTRVHRAVSQVHPYLHTKTKPDPRQGNALTVFISWKKRKRRRSASADGHDSEPRCENGSRRGQGALDKGSGFVRFALRKEEREHHRVAAALSKVLRVPLSALSFAGMKDKMAITTQACVVKGVPPGKILASNGSIAGVTVGNLAFCNGPLSVGELSGNRFSVAIRGVSAPGAVIERAVREASASGFVNFFGTQRVGAPSAAAQGMPLPYQIGRDMLAGEWEAAAKKILFPRDGDSPAVREALTDLRDGKIGPKECLRRAKGKNRLFQENAVLQGLARFGDSAYREALQRVPYAMRTLWVRAYQSHIWNSMASERIRLLGPRAVLGDLILLSDCSDPHKGSEVEVSGCAVVKETVDVGGSRRHGMPGSEVKGVVTVLTNEKMESLALEGVTAKRLLRRVVLPLPGRSVQYPSHQIGDLYKRRLDQDGVNPLMWCTPDPEKPVVSMGLGNYMTSPALATDDSCTVPGQILSNAPVPENAPPIVVSGDAVGSNTGKVDLVGTGVTPRGAYRRLLCTPDDVCWEETTLWGRPDCYQGCSNEAEAGGSGDGATRQCRRNDEDVAEVGAAEGVAEAEVGRKGHGQGKVEDVAMSFTLPAGSFATMYLREVMKSDHDIVWGSHREEEEN